MFSHLLFFLFWAIWAVSAASVTFPTTVEIDLVFPLNKTYNLIDPFPVIFVIQNTAPAWYFGFDLEWNITGIPDGASSFPETIGPGFLFGSQDPDHPVPPPDPYIVANSTRFPSIAEKLPAGKWTLAWSYGSRTCTQDGDYVDINLVEQLAQGSISFTVEGGGASPDFTSGCPILAGQVGMTADLLGCPQIGTPNASNPCGAKVDAAQASSISAVLSLSTPTSSATGGSLASGATGILTMSGSSASGSTSTSTTSASMTSTTNIAGREQLRSGLLGAAAGIAGLGILLL
jgi:hypothetical protein